MTVHCPLCGHTSHPDVSMALAEHTTHALNTIEATR
jgi:hypothetical protein